MIGLIVHFTLAGLVVFAIWFWAVLDCIATDGVLVRSLPKQMWVIIVLFVPTVGAIAWLLLGRPEHAGLRLGGDYRPPTYGGRQPRTRGLEDSPDWRPATRASTPTSDIGESPAVRERRLREWEAELAKREAALDETDDDPAADG